MDGAEEKMLVVWNGGQEKSTSKVDTVVNLSTSECASVAFHQASRSEEPPILLAWQERLIFGTERVLQASCNSAIGGWRRRASDQEDGSLGCLGCRFWQPGPRQFRHPETP